MENIIIFGDWKFLMENCWKIVEVDNAVKLNKHPLFQNESSCVAFCISMKLSIIDNTLQEKINYMVIELPFLIIF